MQKEEIFAVLDRLVIDQKQYNKFLEHTDTFTKEPRCKKGCLAFIEEVFNLPEVAGRDQLAICLVSSKTQGNARDTRHFIMEHPITIGYGQALQQARLSLLRLIAEYILETSRRLDETTLSDKHERQVFLRRAVARLITLFQSGDMRVVIKADQWSEVKPFEWIDYLTSDLQTLVGKIDNDEAILKWSSHLYDVNNLNCDYNLESLRGYIDYLDTFTEF
jgi:hypothetical protein